MPSSTDASPTTAASPGLNVIALVSGGKDSLYSILHCIRNGHTIVALGNLHPSLSPEDNGEEEDIDSFMYQTIGHSVVPLYEEALGIPLYRAPITGGAVDTARVYRHQQPSDRTRDGGDQDQDQDREDETESLIPLLRRIKHHHPEANALSAGAILSTYQRTRIENVAARMGLTPLAWLWMYPALPAPVGRQAMAVGDDAGLLEDMAACGCEARIIKVASGGLDEGVLWEDVSGPGRGFRGRLVKAMGRFAAKGDIRGAVLGEGGEYESLALDGPGFLWKGRIEVGEREVRRGEGGVAFMRLRGARCAAKQEDRDDGIMPRDVPRPGLLDGAFAGLLSMPLLSVDDDPVLSSQPDRRPTRKPEPTQTNHGGLWTISNLTALEAGPDTTQQMQAITQKIQTTLSTSSSFTTTDDIVFATVLLRSMADFTPMNNVYVSLFQKPNPPARATVACGGILPEGVNVMVSLVVDQGPRSARHCLHVQSRSYWAPANIGPYSQGISVPLSGSRLVYVAGQIPLEPASMDVIPESGFMLRAVLSLQHLWRIGMATQVNWWVGGIAYLTASGAGGEHDDVPVRAKARAAWQVWERMHTKPEPDDEDDDEDAEPVLDAWDIKYGGAGAYDQSLAPEEIPALPDFHALQQSSTTIPPFLAAQVAELPRNSDIEWQALGCQCRELTLSEQATTTTTIDNNLTFITLEIGLEHSGPGLGAYLQNVLETYNRPERHVILYTAQALEAVSWPGQIVPCKGVWGKEGRSLIAGVVVNSLSST